MIIRSNQSINYQLLTISSNTRIICKLILGHIITRQSAIDTFFRLSIHNAYSFVAGTTVPCRLVYRSFLHYRTPHHEIAGRPLQPFPRQSMIDSSINERWMNEWIIASLDRLTDRLVGLNNDWQMRVKSPGPIFLIHNVCIFSCETDEVLFLWRTKRCNSSRMWNWSRVTTHVGLFML